MRHLAIAARLLGAVAVALLLWTLARGFYGVTFVHDARTAAHAGVRWSLLLLASFAGWGYALNAWLFPRDRADWGLRCAWGWGVTVVLGGLLCATGLAKRAELFAWAALGLALLGVALGRAYGRWSRRPPLRRIRLWLADLPYLAGAAATSVLACVVGVEAITTAGTNANDDGVAYVTFAREILARGTLTQPFSLRRMSSYGGKSVLDALQLAIDVPDGQIQSLDNGMATLTVLALIGGYASAARRRSRAILLLTMLVVVTLENVRYNASATMVGVVFFLGLYRTLDWSPVARAHGWRSAAPVAVMAAAACTLRQNFLVPIGVLLVVAYGWPVVREARLRPFRLGRHFWLDAAITASLLVAFLVPWWALSYRWLGTFLFPVMKGYYNAKYSFFPHRTAFEWMHYVWDNVCYCFPFRELPVMLVAALTMRESRSRPVLAALNIAAFVGFFGLLYGYPAGYVEDQARYYFGYTFAAVLAIALAVADSGPRPRGLSARGARLTSVALVVAAFSIHLYEGREYTHKLYDGFLTKIATYAEHPPPWSPTQTDASYAQAQSVVPAGAPIAVMVDLPGHFDQARNRIATLDNVGAVSPPPGIPLDAGPDAVSSYLLAAGYRYLVVIQSEKAINLYRRDVWEHLKEKSAPKVMQDSATFYLAAFDDFDKLRQTRVRLAEVGGLTTLDLATRVP